MTEISAELLRRSAELYAESLRVGRLGLLAQAREEQEANSKRLRDMFSLTPVGDTPATRVPPTPTIHHLLTT